MSCKKSRYGTGNVHFERKSGPPVPVEPHFSTFIEPDDRIVRIPNSQARFITPPPLAPVVDYGVPPAGRSALDRRLAGIEDEPAPMGHSFSRNENGCAVKKPTLAKLKFLEGAL